MVVVDSNVLISATDSRHVHHAESIGWLEWALGGGDTVGFAWQSLLGYLRVTTSRAGYPNPITIDEATSQVERWLSAPGAVVVEPTARHSNIVRSLLLEAGAAGKLVHDAHLAALAIERGAEVVSYDHDFARFTGVKHRLPVAP
jgi:toxin-antitoxin system PIN domain toxin